MSSNPLLKNLESDVKLISQTLSQLQQNSPDLTSQLNKLQMQFNSLEEQISPHKSAVQLPSIKSTFRKHQNRRPIKSILQEQNTRKLTADPQNAINKAMLTEKFNLPGTGTMRSRSYGKNLYQKPKLKRLSKPKVLPKKYRNDPQGEPPPITEQDVQEGVFSLINRGLIPKDVDLTPAFERGNPPFKLRPVEFHDWREMGPPAVQHIEIVPYEESPQTLEKFYEPIQLTSLPEPKPYEQVMDAYSEHQVIIRKGKLMVTPEFSSFKRVYSEGWSCVAEAISFAEKLLGTHGVGLAILDGKKLAERVCGELRKVKEQDILECLLNKEQVVPIVRGSCFRSRIAKDLAAVKIQAAWRGYKALSAYQQLLVLIEKAKIIQKAFRKYLKKLN